MKNKLFTSCSALIALTGLILGTSTGFASSTITVETATELQSLFNGYMGGPPPTATFQDPNLPPGPNTVASGTPTNLFVGPAGAPTADTVLLVLSAASPVPAGTTISLSFDSATGSPVTFTAPANFFTSSQAGIPTGINGIANGAVNGIKFDSAVHAAADITFSPSITPTSTTTGSILGAVTINSPIALRVDVFSDSGGKIIDNAANSGALGVVPEPSPMALFAVSAIGLMGVMVVRHRRQHCTSA